MIRDYQGEMISWKDIRHLPLVLVVEQGTHKPLVATLPPKGVVPEGKFPLRSTTRLPQDLLQVHLSHGPVDHLKE